MRSSVRDEGERIEKSLSNLEVNRESREFSRLSKGKYTGAQVTPWEVDKMTYNTDNGASLVSDRDETVDPEKTSGNRKADDNSLWLIFLLVIFK